MISDIIIFLLSYTLIITLIRIFKIGAVKKDENKNICPSCNGTLKRTKRNYSDKTLTHLSFNLLRWKRYACFSCYWEGRKW